MDQDALVEKLTKEVIERLQKETAGTGGSSSAAGSPAGLTGQVIKPADLAKYIDNTLLKPDATKEQIEKLCEEAKEYKFYSVCVNSSWVERCAKKLRGTGVKVCSVVGFPLGAMDSRAKAAETRHALEAGADEIDMVINVGALKSGNVALVEEDIRAVVRASRQFTVVKVIIEAALLTEDEKVIASQLTKKAGADFVKTSTGFAKSGATVPDVALMRRVVGEKMGVKAAGGVRSLEDALAMIAAGATRLGTSSGVAIVTGQKSTSSY